MTQAYEIANRQSMQRKSKDVDQYNVRGPCTSVKYVRAGR